MTAPTCAPFACVWVLDYCVYRCTVCGLRIPEDCAPWLPDEGEDAAP